MERPPLFVALLDGMACLRHTLDEETARRVQDFATAKAREEMEQAAYQAMEALIYNLNTMHNRTGAQIPFSSNNYDTNTSSEGRMMIRCILRATQAGLEDGETPIFPIQIFRMKEGGDYNHGNPNYDLFRLAYAVSARRLFPNFSFQDAPFNLQYYRSERSETEIASWAAVQGASPTFTTGRGKSLMAGVT